MGNYCCCSEKREPATELLGPVPETIKLVYEEVEVDEESYQRPEENTFDRELDDFSFSQEQKYLVDETESSCQEDKNEIEVCFT